MQDYADSPVCASTLGAAISKPSIFQQLTERKQSLEYEVGKVNAAIDALTANPELATVLDQNWQLF